MVVVAKALPPVTAAYQCNVVPVATKLATVPELQKTCALADGAEVVFTVTKTGVLALSQLFKVCET